ncbi:unnamed protein product [Lupinus luteus]|uniref:Transcription factor UPBEAT1 n=1 Tax=Lupinus luteus TaxID=3873 RepID=A0AAV1X359_LUPLU
MGISSHPSFVSFSLKDMLQRTEDKRNSSSYGYLWSKVVATKSKKQKVIKKSVKGRRPIRIIMKRRGSYRRGVVNGIQKRVRTLKRLVPNSDSMGLDGLFRETADYILALQTRVEVMKVMVNVLTESDE